MRGLMAFYEAGRKRGDFDEGIRSGLTRILASPHFLYRATVADPANKIAESTYRLHDLELASRLSFFLWSSVPDDQLLEVAEAGRLKDRAVLQQPGDADAERRALAHAGEQFRLPMAAVERAR